MGETGLPSHGAAARAAAGEASAASAIDDQDDWDEKASVHGSLLVGDGERSMDRSQKRWCGNALRTAAADAAGGQTRVVPAGGGLVLPIDVIRHGARRTKSDSMPPPFVGSAGRLLVAGKPSERNGVAVQPVISSDNTRWS